MVDRNTLKVGDYVRVLDDWRHEDKESPYFFQYIRRRGLKKGDIIRVERIDWDIKYDASDYRNFIDFHQVEPVPAYKVRSSGIGKLVLMSLASGTLLAGVTQMQDLLHDPLVQKALTGLIALIAALIGGNLTWVTFKSVIASFGRVGDRHREIKKAKWEHDQKVSAARREINRENDRLEAEREALRARDLLKIEKDRAAFEADLAAKKDADAKRNMAEMVSMVLTTLKPEVANATSPMPGMTVTFEGNSHPESYLHDGTGVRRPRKGDQVKVDMVNPEAKTFTYYSNSTRYTANFRDLIA